MPSDRRTDFSRLAARYAALAANADDAQRAEAYRLFAEGYRLLAEVEGQLHPQAATAAPNAELTPPVQAPHLAQRV